MNESEKQIPWHPRIVIKEHHSCGILVIEKPPGLLSHPNDKKSIHQSIIQAPFDPKTEAFIINKKNPIFLNNRLDSPTSGLIVLSDSQKCKQYLDHLFKENKITKIYYALVKGIPHSREAIWQDRLQTSKGKNLRTQTSRSGIPSKTEMRLIKSTRKTPIPISLIELRPLTGRTHQLRVQAASRKMPILGDGVYGDFKMNRLLEKSSQINRLCLHAREIRIPLPNQECLTVQTKADFENSI